MNRTYEEINEKIKSGKVNILTAPQAKELIDREGVKYLLKNVDVVTCATFEMNTNVLLYLNFGQTDPLIYFLEAYINNVFAYPVGPTDLIISSVQVSKDKPDYSGANIIEDLIAGKELYLKASGKNLEIFPNKEFETYFNLKTLGSARLFLNQAANQNNIVATNAGEKDLNTHMGTLIGKLENSTFNSSSYLNPLVNDPYCKTIGVGSRVWVSGATGYVTGSGSNHNPKQKRNKFDIPVGPAVTLGVIADVERMIPKWIRGGYIKSYGPVLYAGIGVPIPVLNEEIAEYLSITDENIETTIVDFSIPRRTKPTFGQCNYKELRSTTVLINRKPTLAAPLSSMAMAIEVCEALKQDILNKKFYLSEPIAPINMNVDLKKLDVKMGEPV